MPVRPTRLAIATTFPKSLLLSVLMLSLPLLLLAVIVAGQIHVAERRHKLQFDWVCHS